MFADTDLQLWLDTQVQAQQTQIVIYAQSPRPTELGYRLSFIQRGPHGQSSVQQAGQKTLLAGQPLALSHLAMRLHEGDDCRIELTTRADEQAPVVHLFDCPRPSRAPGVLP